MAEITQTLVVDDFDKTQAADETLLWVFDGEALRSDLTRENAAELRAAIKPFRDSARSLGKQKVVGRAKTKRAARSVPATPVPDEEPAAEPIDPRWFRSIRNGPVKIEAAKKKYRDMARKWGEQRGFEMGLRVPQEVFDAYHQYRESKGLPVGPASVGLE
ncbi:histone-like nucleoid-structuring protein Lsr2 [Amycolatopsis sp. SB7-3]|uniref:Lsr2 dimerization domain-containing protein n=1 Tax=Amycolatopsis sp. SB7-3 TaxID=3373438 RepID=UPI003743422B